MWSSVQNVFELQNLEIRKGSGRVKMENDFRGKWITRVGHHARVIDILPDGSFSGIVVFVNPDTGKEMNKIDNIWKADGNSICGSAFDLVERIRKGKGL